MQIKSLAITSGFYYNSTFLPQVLFCVNVKRCTQSNRGKLTTKGAIKNTSPTVNTYCYNMLKLWNIADEQ